MSKATTPRDLRAQPREALVSVREICLPVGPAPVGRSQFLLMVKTGAAPAPVLKAARCTRWRWGDVQDWLIAIAEQGRL